MILVHPVAPCKTDEGGPLVVMVDLKKQTNKNMQHNAKQSSEQKSNEKKSFYVTGMWLLHFCKDFIRTYQQTKDMWRTAYYHNYFCCIVYYSLSMSRSCTFIFIFFKCTYGFTYILKYLSNNTSVPKQP